MNTDHQTSTSENKKLIQKRDTKENNTLKNIEIT